MESIRFFNEDIPLPLKQKVKHRHWIKTIVLEKEKEIKEINFIFCSDNYLHQINIEYLGHDDLTDIITFDNSEHPNEISGDIFISYDRIKENAIDHGTSADIELRRVMIHGILHLLGFKDKEPGDKIEMTFNENESLNKWLLLDVPRGTSKRS